MTSSSTKTSISNLEVRGLSADYGGNPVFENLNFKLPYSSFVAVIGRNGCGKSTLLRCLAGRLHCSGTISYGGFKGKNPSHSCITYLSQKNHIAFPISVKELVVMGSFRKKGFFQVYNKEDYHKAETVLKRAGLEHKTNESFPELSGGQQQMAWLSQCLLQDEPVMILDEPTQQLDVGNKKRVFSILQEESAKGKTVICATHDLFNLQETEGYYLNLSDSSPQLKSLSPEAIQEEYKKLAEGH